MTECQLSKIKSMIEESLEKTGMITGPMQKTENSQLTLVV